MILAGLRARKMRLLLTAAAISLGVAFVVGTITLTGTLEAQLLATTARQAQDVAVRVSAPDLTDADLTTLRSVTGVESAVAFGVAEGALLGADGRVIDTFGDGTSTLRTMATDRRLAGFDLTTGDYPVEAGEAVVDRDTAATQGWQPGVAVQLVSRSGETVPLRLAGIADVQGGQPTVYLMPEDFRKVTGERAWSHIHIRATTGAGQAELHRSVTAALASRDVSVVTGSAYADQLASAAVGDIDIIRAGLGAFALIALLVSAMVIHNTFTILVAQRQRELALLRCVGARRGQVFRTVLIEAATMGGLAAVIGLGLGFGLGWAGSSALGGFSGMGLDVPVRVEAAAVAAAAVVGIGITVLAAMSPARRATRVTPMAALTDHPDLVESRRAGVLRATLGMAGLLLGAAVVIVGAAEQQPVLAVAGALPALIGAIAIGPVLVAPLGRRVGRVPAALFGVAGRLAAGSPERNPRRAAATVLALTVGITLVSAFLVSAESLKESVAFQLRKQFPVDYVVAAPKRHRLPAELGDQLAAVPEVDRAVVVASATMTLQAGAETTTADVGGMEPTVVQRDFGLPIDAGTVAAFGTGRVLMNERTASELAVGPGDPITITGGAGAVEVTVAGVISGSMYPLPEVILAPADASTTLGQLPPRLLLLWITDGVLARDARTAIGTVIDTVPLAMVIDLKAQGDQIAGVVDGLLVVVSVLIVLSVMIAVIGIANTLTLSALERTHEFGLLRAIGLGRRQLRTMLLAEGAILALIAAVSGVVLGVGFGVAGAYAAIPHHWLTVSLPYGRIALVVLGAAVVGLLAAVVPARRAARVAPVTALTAE